MKYIDADKLKAKIEFAKSVYDNPKRVVHGVADAFMQDGRAAMCEDILNKIDSLQQEQAEKDHELTIKDLELLHTFLYAIKNNKQGVFTFTRLSDEQYEEVLRRFKVAKNEQH